MKTKMDNIIEKTNLLLSIWEQSNIDENLWQTKNKKFIYDTLAEIVKEISIPSYVQLNEEIKNSESVILALKKIPSKYFDNSNGKYFFKQQGYVLFTPQYNFKIACYMVFPKIEEITKTNEPKFLGNTSQSTLSKDFIYKMVAEFINEIIIYEKEDENPKIGFQFSRSL